MKKLLLVLLMLVVYPAYGQDYTVTQVEVKPPLQNIYETGGTNLNLADDGMATDVKIGFDFEFYGNIFNTVNISNNGFITFGGLNSACCQGEPLPSFYMDNTIMALWTDLISINGMNPYYKSYAVDGNRVFTVGWYNTLEFYNPDWTNTFEITLYEGSNNILFNYENLNVYQHTLTAGIQGTNGQSEQIYYGNSTQALSNSAYLFEYTPATPIDPETPIAPDCTVNPAYINCIINTNTLPEVYLAENNTETTTDTEQVIGGVPPDLELLLSETKNEPEEKEEIKDNISTEILEQVLVAEITSNREKSKNDNSENVIETQTIIVENITIDSSETSEISDVQNTETSDANTEESQVVELPVLAQNKQDFIVENITVESNVEETTTEQIVENSIQQSIAIDQEQVTELVNKVVSQQNDEVEEFNNILANSQKTFTEEQTDDEQLTMAYVQPGSNAFGNNNTFNIDPNMADKEASGVLGKAEEKSDAEKRAEEIVAANKEQQEEISKNYMDSDQSGLIGAMTDGTDVSSYRTAMIPELSIWYKPEDIYKNVKYNDNVRGSYFLEKGNTDTYKKMVDEQYK